MATAVDGKTVDRLTSSRTLANTFLKIKLFILQGSPDGLSTKKKNDAYRFFQHYIYISLLDILLFFMHSYSDAEKNKKNNPKKKVKLDSSPRRQTERTRHPAAQLGADKRML